MYKSVTFGRLLSTYCCMWIFTAFALYCVPSANLTFPATLWFQVFTYCSNLLIAWRGLRISLKQVMNIYSKWSWWCLFPLLFLFIFLFKGDTYLNFTDTVEAVFFVALPEEMIFHCFFSPCLVQSLGKKKGIWMDSILFAAIHIPVLFFWDHLSLVEICGSLLYLTVVGAIYADQMYRTKSLSYLALLHGVGDVKFIPQSVKPIMLLIIISLEIVISFLLSPDEE